jgi:hypothetical protein
MSLARKMRPGSMAIIRSDINSEPPKKPEQQTLHYYLYLPEYGGDSITRQATTHTFNFQISSNQSTDPLVGSYNATISNLSIDSLLGSYNAISVTTMTDEYGNRDPNTIILIKGSRTPGDEDGFFDSNGNIIQRDLQRMYYEDYEITSLHPITKATIGSMKGSLHYVDAGNGNATTQPVLIFPIDNATGIWKDYKNGFIKWFYYNDTALYHRKLIVCPA